LSLPFIFVGFIAFLFGVALFILFLLALSTLVGITLALFGIPIALVVGGILLLFLLGIGLALLAFAAAIFLVFIAFVVLAVLILFWPFTFTAGLVLLFLGGALLLLLSPFLLAIAFFLSLGIGFLAFVAGATLLAFGTVITALCLIFLGPPFVIVGGVIGLVVLVIVLFATGTIVV
jgi:hypothetical protein